MNRHGTFRWSRVVVAALLLLSLAVPAIALAGSPPAAQKKIDPAVSAQLAAQKESTVWVILRAKANLAPAYTMKSWEARGRFVVAQLQATANRSQAGLRALLKSRGKSHKAFWIVNAIRVTADAATVNEVAGRPEVEQIVADGGFSIPDPRPAAPQARVNGVEWGIDRINAPQVWSQFDARGQGIVVANIDTGVQFDHSALVRQYRGNLGDGSFDHNYNWFDPSKICGDPSTQPCDTEGHGTHTMGTMVGDDGGENQIGVAPAARWIAAKGCESNWCSDFALLSSGEWILAPTDLSGQNPRADLRPHIVNNSWGGGGGNTWYEAIVQAWEAAGIFPQFSIGNAGPSCGSAGSPGDYAMSYAAGAFNIDNVIADFSSRGPSAFGETKPNIAAPGEGVRSSVPWGYDWFSGTSMASPHVAGAVTLVWSAKPDLIGNIAATRDILDETAIDMDDQSCGGFPDNNSTWGEGRLDAYAAVQQAIYGPTPKGLLEGHVADANDAQPIAGAHVQASKEGAVVAQTLTNGEGYYRLRLPVGDYTVEASAAYYQGESAQVSIEENQTTPQDFALGSARSEVSPSSFDFFVPLGQTQSEGLSITNAGTAELEFAIGERLAGATGGPARPIDLPAGATTRAAPAGQTRQAATPNIAGGLALVLMDYYPWGSDAIQQVLAANGVPFDIAGSSQMGRIDLSAYQVVFIANDQPSSFYDTYTANLARFEQFVQRGGTLWFGAAAWGWGGGGSTDGLSLPGGAKVTGPLFEDYNDVVDPEHPTMAGLPNPFYGMSASHAAFEALPAGARTIARGQSSGLPTLIEYTVGAGRVLAFGQTLEYGWSYGQDAGRILENAVPYVFKAPWLTADPARGTLPPGATQEVAITVDTAGLSGGVYRAGLFVYTNDPANPRRMLPVTMVVPAYYQAVNAGGKAYTDGAGLRWAADQKYAAGAWGYTSASSKAASTKRGIAGTDDDPLYQFVRESPGEYRFDGLPDGVYEVELRFADIKATRAGLRLFDVYIENGPAIPAHDIVAEVGRLTADSHIFYVPVSDGQLNIRLAPRGRGYQPPVVSAIRVLHRPDR